jgi:hypothetical protein
MGPLDFSVDLILPSTLWHWGVDSASKRNEYQKSSWGVKGSRHIRLINSPPSMSRLSRENVGASKSHNPMDIHGPLQGYLYLIYYTSETRKCILQELVTTEIWRGNYRKMKELVVRIHCSTLQYKYYKYYRSFKWSCFLLFQDRRDLFFHRHNDQSIFLTAKFLVLHRAYLLYDFWHSTFRGTS